MDCTVNILKKLKESREVESDSVDIDYEDLMKYYAYAEYFEDREKEESRLRDLLDKLEGSGMEYEVYNSKEDKSCTVFHDSKEAISEADESHMSVEYKAFIDACTSNPTWKKANAICEKYGYQLSKESCVEVYPSGKKVPSVNFKVDRTKEYNPEVYYYAGKFGNINPSMEIQTTAYGSLNLEEYAKFLESVTNAYKMVKELEKIDFTTLHEDKVDY